MKEIILVGDASDRGKEINKPSFKLLNCPYYVSAYLELTFYYTILFVAFLRKPLEDYVASLPISVQILRSEKRTGLVRARLLGARKATGTCVTPKVFCLCEFVNKNNVL